MTAGPRTPGAIVGVRLVPGWFGRPRLEICRELRRLALVAGELGTERCGTGHWHRPARRDAHELAVFLDGKLR